MRWKYSDPDDLAEQKARAETLGKIAAWWRAFSEKHGDIDALFHRKQNWDLPQWIHDNLNPIDSRLMWEFGPGLTGGHRLIITPESVHQLRPLVDVILQNAPQIPGWEFYAYRVPEDLEQTVRTVEGRTRGDITQTRFKAERGSYNNIDLVFSAPNYTEENHKQASNDCFVACETLLGEEALDKWMGCFDVIPGNDMDGGFLPIGELLPTFRALNAQIVNSLPDRPCMETSNTAEWTMYDLKPKEADDYPGQLDMFVGKTMFPEMWTCAHSRALFESTRFSKHGETFVYLKIDGTEGLDEEKFQDKGEIEDALDEILIQNSVGSVIGGGTGRKYSYIDLALLDMEKAIPLIQSRLREGNIPRRSWILFFDTYLQDEWVGIWKDTPSPPH